MNKILSVILIFISFSVSAQTSLRNGIKGYWKFEESTGTTAYDQTANDNDFTNSDVVLDSAGIKDKCYYFNGTSSVLTLSSASDFEGLTGLTVSAWVYTTYWTTGDEYSIIVSKLHSSWESPFYQFQLRVRHGAYDRYEFVVGSSSTFGGVESSNDTYIKGEWVHLLACWYNNGEMKLYINGILADDTPSESVTTATGSATSSLTIGDDNDAYSGFKNWSGKIDEVMILNRFVSENEIKMLYNGGDGLLFVQENFKNNHDYGKLAKYFIGKFYLTMINNL